MKNVTVYWSVYDVSDLSTPILRGLFWCDKPGHTLTLNKLFDLTDRVLVIEKIVERNINIKDCLNPIAWGGGFKED